MFINNSLLYIKFIANRNVVIYFRLYVIEINFYQGNFIMRKYLFLLLSASVILPAAAFAEKTPAPVPTLGSVLEASGITATGFVDVMYTANTGTGKYASGSAYTTNSNNNRVFDVGHNSFLLNAANLTLSKLPTEGVGGLIDVTVGKDADTIASYGTINSAKGPANGEDQFFDVTQAYINYATGPLTLMAGKYNTLAGAEVIKTTGNSNISRSILFGYAIPFTHTGLRGTYKVNDILSLIAVVNNGWDDVQDTNGQKSGEFGISLTPNKTVSLTVQDYVGTEHAANYTSLSANSGTRNLVDAVLTVNATDKLTFIVNSDYGTQENVSLAKGTTGKASWYGVAGYVNYQLSDQWRTSLRGEIFKDEDGYRTAYVTAEKEGQTQKEITLTQSFMPAKNAEFRIEVRHDFSDQAIFAQPNGSNKKSQDSLALEAIYKF